MNDLSLKVMGPDPATRAQHVAADPDRSTWLTANAGSGKTSVLTDRVARLLLAGRSGGPGHSALGVPVAVAVGTPGEAPGLWVRPA
ncbi:UvrD-helicase domain-containing protein, partial [Mycobacterium tuberculosis]|nr:UvrD-helicase domain-containing protein [Mycobacterium tuberculosis]